jgi:hypothetical protein
MGDYSADPAVRLAQLEKEVAALEDRLEVYATNDDGTKTYLGIGDCDGIGCRNETIKLQEKNCETLRAVRAELESKLDRIRRWAVETKEAKAAYEVIELLGEEHPR